MANLNASALLASGAVLLAMVAIRAATAASFASRPPMASRAGDPLGFWLGVAIPAAFGLALCLAALVRVP